MKKLLILSFLVSILLPRELFLNTNEVPSVKGTHHSQGLNIDSENNLITNKPEKILLFSIGILNQLIPYGIMMLVGNGLRVTIIVKLTVIYLLIHQTLIIQVGI